MRKRRVRTTRDVIATGGPWYGLRADGIAHQSVTGYGTGVGVSLTLLHSWQDAFLRVETDTNPFEDTGDAHWGAVHDVLVDYVPYGPLHPADFPVRIEISRREVELPVDGKAVTFVVIGDDQRWEAWGRFADRTIRLSSKNYPVEQVRLTAVDPEAEYEIPPTEPMHWRRGRVARWRRW